MLVFCGSEVVSTVYARCQLQGLSAICACIVDDTVRVGAVAIQGYVPCLVDYICLQDSSKMQLQAVTCHSSVYKA